MIINPVQVVSEFLKSSDGKIAMAVLAENDRRVALGTVDDVLIVLEKDGFKAVGKNGGTEPASAYDVFDCFTTRKTERLEERSVSIAFLRFVKESIVAKPA